MTNNKSSKRKSGRVVKGRQNYTLNNSLPNAEYRSSRRKSQRSNDKYPPNANKLTKILYRFKPQNIYNYWFSLRGLLTVLKLIGLGVLAGIILFVIAYINIGENLPPIRSLYGTNMNGSIRYYDRTGKVLLWTDYNAVNRTPVQGSAMSSYVRNATVAIEDKSFYHEGPIDYLGILRSAVHDILNLGSGLEGGSTITQQLVKLNEGWIGNVTVFRKIKEVILAYDLSNEYSKSTILTGYLNIAPYGGVDYGVAAASEDYFNIPPSQLSLAQSAMLAAIPQSPAYYSPRSPYFNLQALDARKNYILSLMEQQGYITQKQEKSAIAVNVVSEVKPSTGLYSNMVAPYFVLTAKNQLQKQFGATTAKEGGWNVITTLSVPQQNQAQQLVANNYNNVVKAGGNEEAVVVENAPTGQVTALVGGTNFYNPNYGQINYATTMINPGSTYKLYDYTALINDNSVGAGSVLYDIQQPLPGYPCTNKALPLNGGNCLYDYDFQYPGPLTVRYAFAGSRNVPAVKAMLINGESKTISLSEAMGLKSGYNCYANSARTIKTTCYGSAAIGEGGFLRLNESVNGFATDSRLGNYVPQTYILKITDASGKTVYQWKQPKPNQVVKPDAAYIVDNILSDPAASYLPGYCGSFNCSPLSSFGFKFQHTNGWDVAVKTGTTHNDESGLMMGMTTQYVVGSWVSYYTTTKPLTPHYGGLEGLTEPLTRGMITYLTQNQKPINWTPPAGIQTLPAYVVNNPPAAVLGHYYGWIYPSPSTDIYPSWYTPPKLSGTSQTIDKVSKLLADSCTPALARETITNNSASLFSVDTFYNGGSLSSVTGVDNVHLCNDVMPSVSITQTTCDTTDKCNVTVQITQGTHPLTGGSYTSFPAGTISLFDNGKSIQTINIPNGVTSPYMAVFNGATLPVGSVITAQVVDSVLDSGTSTPVTVSASMTTTTTTPTTTSPATPPKSSSN